MAGALYQASAAHMPLLLLASGALPLGPDCWWEVAADENWAPL